MKSKKPTPQRPPAKPGKPGTGTSPRLPEKLMPLLREGMGKQTGGDLDGAEACYRKILAICPQHYEALHLLGVVEHAYGNLDEAEKLIGEAIALHGGESPYFAMNYGLVLQKLGRLEEAERHCRQVLKHLPNSVQAHFNLASLLQETEQLREAEHHYHQVLAIDPRNAASWVNLAKLHEKEGNLGIGLDCAAKAVEAQPNFVEAMETLGVLLHDHYRLDECVHVLLQVLAIRPDSSIALSNIALSCRQMGRMEESMAYYGRLLLADLDNFYAHYNLALLLLENGDLVNGWAEFEYRWRDQRATNTKLRPLPQPRWEGSPLQGKTLLVWGEQGVGDHIRMASLFGELAAQAGKLIVETDPRVLPLFSRSFPTVDFVAEKPEPDVALLAPDIDLQSPMVSCARWLRTRLADFPVEPAYLIADAAKRGRWAERLAAIPGKLKVGVSWRSGLTAFGREFSYADIAQWLPVLSIPDIAFINLQYGDCHDELARLRELGGPELHQWPDIDLKDDFDDVAALVSELDLVVSAPISVAELSAGLGIPTWILLLNHVSYVNHGTDGYPWHPSVRLFSREWNEAWEPIIAHMAESLSDMAHGLPESILPLSQPELLNQQGIAAYQAGEYDAAIGFFRMAAELAPDCADYPSNHGSALQAQGRHADAETLFRQALATQPDHATTYFNLGNLFKTQGRLTEAETAYRQALDLDPGSETAWNNLGTMLLDSGRHDEACEAFEHLLALDPTDALAHGNLALGLKSRGQTAEAESHLRQAIALAPDFAEAHNNLGNLLTSQQRYEEAISAFLHALDIRPDYFEAVNNLGRAYADDFRFDEAIQCFEALLAVQPDNGRTLNGLGSVLTQQGRLADAAKLFMKALAVRFDDYDAHCNLGQVALQMGDLGNGWDGYAQRFQRENRPVRTRAFPMPWWDGSDLAGKSLLIWGEQGVGDEIRFASVVPDAASGTKHCLLECDPRLADLFARSFPGVQVIPRSEPLAAVQSDWQSPVGNLMCRLRRDLASFPGTPYLRPATDRVAHWKRRLEALPPGRRIGFAWRSRNINRQRSECYPPLAEWLPLFQTPGIVWIDLQYDPQEGELDDLRKTLGTEIHHFADLDLTNDFDDVAALMANLDAVVAVATAVPELSGACGIPTYVVEFAHFSPMSLGQQNSPWHASRRNFYRRLGEPWAPTITELAQALNQESADAVRTDRAADPQAIFREGMACHQAGDIAAAEALYAQVLALDPNHADALHLYGVIAHQHGQHARAEALIRQAIRINPRIPWYFGNLGNVCKAQDNLIAAALELRRAVRLDPSFADGHYNLANILREQGLLDEAERHYRLAITLEPENATFHSNLALILLQQGRLEEGWELHDRWRWGNPGGEQDRLRLRFTQRPWSGEPLSGKGIAVWAEQGIGDEIRFASQFSDLLNQTHRVVIEVDKRLIALFSRSWPQARFVARAAELDPALTDAELDFQCPAGGLGRWVRPALASFPRVAYLKADKGRTDFWKARLKALGKGLKVGICWRSNVRNEQRNRSYADIEDWAPVLTVPGIVFVNLQYGDCADEVARSEQATASRIHGWDDIDLMNDLDDVAALMHGLDLVISAPTAVAEMAGALGLPTWTLFYAHESPMELGTGPTVPWYADMRKFVRSAGENWRNVLEAVAACLHGRADARFDLGAIGAKWALEGKRQFEGRNLAAAISLYRKTLLISPGNSHTQHLLGVALYQSGFHELAEKAIRTALPREKNRAMRSVMWSNLGAAQQDLGLDAEAEVSYRNAIGDNRKHVEAHYNLARLLGKQEKWEEAIAMYHEVMTLNPNLAEAYNNVGNWLMEQKLDVEGALPYFEKAVALKPNDAINRFNLGKALHDLFDLDRAVDHYRRALALKPDYAKAANNLGACLRHMGRIDEAMAQFDRVFEIDPTDVEGLFNTGFIHLLKGELAQGWDLLEYRWLRPNATKKRSLPQAWWDGSSLDGKRIVVWGDQGVGDEMRAYSMIPDLTDRGADVLVECDHRLVSLLKRSFPSVSVVPRGLFECAELSDRDIDFQCCASGLARWLRRDFSDFPVRTSYFKPDDARRQFWRERLAALGPGLKVGISWRSRLMSRERRRSYTALDEWGPILTLPGIHFINLQYDQCEAEITAAETRFGIAIHRWPDLDLMNDLDDVAALNANLDLVVTAPTAVGELSGSLGIPTWTMLLKHESSMDLGTGGMPWEPTVKLYYREWDDAWERIINRLAEDMRSWMAKQLPGRTTQST